MWRHRCLFQSCTKSFTLRIAGGSTTNREMSSDAPTSDILRELERVDPIMASRWHPNDHRKIRRSLEIFLTTQTKASDLYASQRSMDLPKSHDSGCSRFRNLLFWVHAKNDTLNNKLDKR